MPDSTLDSQLFTLVDNWPNTRITIWAEPTGGFTGSTHHDVATPQFSRGEKISIMNQSTAGQEGWSTFIYLTVGTQNANSLIAAKSLVVPDSGTDVLVVTNDPDDCLVNTGCLLAAYALSAMTNTYSGWFWCGGICPEYFVSGLGGNYATDGNVVAGALTVHDLAADALGLGPRATTEGFIGFSVAADA